MSINWSEDETASARSNKWLRFETDEEDTSSVASLNSDADEPRAPWHLAPRAQVQNGPRRRPRRLTGRARADEFVATVRLLAEVEALRRHRDELLSLQYARVLNAPRRDLSMNTTIEYYDCFRNGFSGPRIPEMVRYFNTRLDHEVFAYGGSGFGLDTWIEQWRRYTRMFPSLTIHLSSLDTVDLQETMGLVDAAPRDPTVATYIVKARGMLGGFISRQAICTVCPHLRHREDLIQKLVGKPLRCPTELRFYFNSSGRIARLDFDADYFQAFSSIEGVSLVELAEIMEHVAVGENSTVPVPVEVDVEDSR